MGMTEFEAAKKCVVSLGKIPPELFTDLQKEDGFLMIPTHLHRWLIARVEQLEDYTKSADALIEQNHKIINEQGAEVERLQGIINTALET